MSKWNFGDVWEAVADAHPRRRPSPTVPAPDLGRVRPSGRRLARWLLDAGWPPGQVALYLYNCPEYLEATSPASRSDLSRSIPTTAMATTNWSTCGTTPTRWRWSSTASSPTGSRGSAPTARLRSWLWVDDGNEPAPMGHPLRGGRREPVRRRTRPTGPWGRSPDDLYMLYTGGTTGMPKGVMWRQDDLFARLTAPVPPLSRGRGCRATCAAELAAAVRA